MEIQKLIEEINRLTEDDMDEVTLQDEIEPEQPAEVVDEPEFNDNMSLADQFDAKARIARALEALKDAVNEFKDATAEKIDLLKDQALTGGIEKLDGLMVEIENALASGSNILGDSELNDPFKTQIPDQTEEIQPEETEEADTEDNEYTDEEADFDAEAGLDLLAGNEE